MFMQVRSWLANLAAIFLLPIFLSIRSRLQTMVHPRHLLAPHLLASSRASPNQGKADGKKMEGKKMTENYRAFDISRSTFVITT